jgi:hypothetical protein
MPAVISFPGFDIEEQPNDARAITGVPTSVTAFVGRTRRGHVRGPIRCFCYGDFERSCGGLWADSELGYAVWQFFENGGSHALISRVTTGASSSSVDLAVEYGAWLGLEAASPGIWGDNLRVTVTPGAAGYGGGFHLTLEELDPSASDPRDAVVATETFEHLCVTPGHPRCIEDVLAQRSALARVSALSDQRPVAVTRAPLTGGDDGRHGSVRDYEDAITRLEQVDMINLLVIPPKSRTADTAPRVLASAAKFCKHHRAMLLVDPPIAWSQPDDAVSSTGLSFLRTPNTAFYYPRVRCPDPLHEQGPRAFAPSGVVAGVIARTDAERGVWTPPCGLEATMFGVSALEVTLAEEQIDALERAGVNGLVVRPAAGPVVWGARTGRGADVLASQWGELGVRRLSLFIHSSLYWGTRWAVFERNEEPLWAQLREHIGAFLGRLFRQGAFAGASVPEAFFVKCDAETTMPAERELGVVNVIIGFAPSVAKEFVILHFQQLAGI